MTWHYICFPGDSAGKKNLPTMWETWVWSLGWENPLEKGTATHSSIPPGEFHGLCSPWGRKEWDMTERLSLSYIENPKDATRKLLEHISKCGKVAGYKINREIYCISIHSQWKIRKRNYGNNFTYHHITKMKISRKRPV